MKHNELYLVLAVILGVSLLVACGSPPVEEEAEAETESEEAGVPVRVAQVNRGDISTSILSTAVIEAEQAVDIYSRVTGTVTAIAAEEGQRVQASQLLCSLEDEELRLNEARARAEMEKLERDLERTRTLVDQEILTESACEAVYKMSGGKPRLIGELIRMCLRICAGEKRQKINEEDVMKSAQEVL